MTRTTAEIEAELAIVNATINRILAGGVSEFQQGGSGGSSDRASMLDLAQLRQHRDSLMQELGRVRRGTRARFLQGRIV